jgi:hypothetical protein
MRKVIGLIVITFALVAGATAFVSATPQQAFACDGDHRGS